MYKIDPQQHLHQDLSTGRRKYLHKDKLFLDNDSNMLDCCMLAFQHQLLHTGLPHLHFLPFQDLFTTLYMVSSAFMVLVFQYNSMV